MTESKYIGNVFVVSRLGQLRNVQNFIKQFNAKENILIIQYSVVDGPILKNMIEICERNLYVEVIYLKLPKRPLHVTKKKNIKMYNSIKNALEYIVNEKYVFNNLFLCNADKWYSYYEKVKKENNFAFSMNLLEEGLTTYIVSADPEYQADPLVPISGSDLKKSIRDVVRTFIDIFITMKNLIVKFGILLLNLISIIFKTNLTKIIKDFALDKTLEEKYKFSYITHFDEAFVCFPEKIEAKNFSIDKINKLNFKFNTIASNQYIDQLNKDYALFINQKYINYRQHFEVLFKIFTKMNLKNIYIKLHPKEDKVLVINTINECLKEFPDLNIEVIHNMDSTPIEDIIYNCHFKQIIGLTSSALLYCNELIKDINIISVADEYRRMCLDKANHVNKKELKLFEKEYKNFEKISNVRQFGGEDKNKTKNNTKVKAKSKK